MSKDDKYIQKWSKMDLYSSFKSFSMILHSQTFASNVTVKVMGTVWSKTDIAWYYKMFDTLPGYGQQTSQ